MSEDATCYSAARLYQVRYWKFLGPFDHLGGDPVSLHLLWLKERCLNETDLLPHLFNPSLVLEDTSRYQDPLDIRPVARCIRLVTLPPPVQIILGFLKLIEESKKPKILTLSTHILLVFLDDATNTGEINFPAPFFCSCFPIDACLYGLRYGHCQHTLRTSPALRGNSRSSRAEQHGS